MRLQGELNVPGAPGVRYQTNPGTGAPVGYTQQPTSFIGLPGGIGNQGAIAHGQHTTDSFVDGVPKYWPGSHDPRQHNELRDPAGRPIPGTAPPDSEIPLGYETNQSSNLPTSITQSSTAFPVGNMAPLIAQAPAGQQTQAQNLLNPLDWFSGRNQQVVDEVEKGTYKGGKGGGIDKMIRRTSDLNRLINEM